VRDGYTLHSWRGACPEEWVDQYAELLSLITQEAPLGDFPLENEFFDAARVRSDEAAVARQGRVMQVSLALSPEGEVAGHTQLSFTGRLEGSPQEPQIRPYLQRRQQRADDRGQRTDGLSAGRSHR